MQLTDRDYEMIRWLDLVKVANRDGLQWALGAFSGAGQPVSVRKVQQWSARLESVGLIGRYRPTYVDGSIVFPTRLATGHRPPNLLRQTTRHEVAVAAVSAHYLASGFEWTRDRKPQAFLDHQADGIAVRGDAVELVEVELTPKSWQRYKLIFEDHGRRLSEERATAVAYYCCPAADRAVRRDADRFMFRAERERLASFSVFDERGGWLPSRPAELFGRAQAEPKFESECLGEVE